MVRILKALGGKRGTSTVMVTHDSLIIELADRTITIEGGAAFRD
ncbi:hypothetical protein [Martelella soudanensis]|nr:hypothetical protein [Martelella sp. NC18]